jgi:hypothetical protein
MKRTTALRACSRRRRRSAPIPAPHPLRRGKPSRRAWELTRVYLAGQGREHEHHEEHPLAFVSPCGGHAPCSHDGRKEPPNLIEKHRAHSRPAPRIHSAATRRAEAHWRPAGRASHCWHRITSGGFWAAAANEEPGIGNPRFAVHRGGSRRGRSAARLEHRVYRTVDRRIRVASQNRQRGVWPPSAR